MSLIGKKIEYSTTTVLKWNTKIPNETKTEDFTGTVIDKIKTATYSSSVVTNYLVCADETNVASVVQPHQINKILS